MPDEEYGINAAKEGNFTRYFNNSCDPNMKVFNVFSEFGDGALAKTAFFAIKEIGEDEELTFTYTPDTKGSEIRPPCGCGAENCRGYI